MNLNFALITPKEKNNYLVDTIIDGLLVLMDKNKNIDFKISSNYPCKFEISKNKVSEAEFISYSNNADVILFFWGKGTTDFDLVKKINRFEKIIFIDSSEIGKNGRYDFNIQKQIINGEYLGNGKIDQEMLNKCPLYFRREKPYKNGIKPFPFGIETIYRKNYSKDIEKDIDFFCVFGQDEYPLMRRYSREILIDFCKKNNFSCFTEKTDKENFYKILARSKVGISVGGGGYDCARFWEILGNNCLLLTEKIDIYEPDSKRLGYDRIWQFNNLFDFEFQLNKVGEYLRKEYDQEKTNEEYNKIISEHSSEARVLEIIERCKKANLLT